MSFTAFHEHRLVAHGDQGQVALEIKRRGAYSVPHFLVFDDRTGQQLDFDLRGTDEEVLARLSEPEPEPVRPRGRPKLGVVAREVTLLESQWEWLSAQPGGASATLRKLVQAARKENWRIDPTALDATYRFLSAIAGNLAGFEEVSRALFASDLPKFEALMSEWPTDIREYALRRVVGKPEPPQTA